MLHCKGGMTVKRMILAWVCLCLFIGSANAETTVTVGTNLDDEYYAMEEAFLYGDYDEAMEIYESHPGLVGHLDAEKYYRYMQALDAVEREAWDEAFLLFASVKDFRDSEAYGSYVMGRLAEESGAYEDAISYYLACANLKGIDLLSRLSACSNKVQEEQKKVQYESTVDALHKAQEENDVDAVQRLLAVFRGMGNYRDAVAYGKEIEAWLRDAAREMRVQATVQGDALKIEWTDNEEGHTYLLSWNTGSEKTETTVRTDATTYTVAPLIPSTIYTVKVSDADKRSVSATTEAMAPSVARYQSAAARRSGFDIAAIRRSALERMDAADIYNQYREQLVYTPEESRYSEAVFDRHALYAVLTLENKNKEDLTLSVYVVLRGPQTGVYRSDECEVAVPGSLRYPMFCLDVQGVLDQLMADWGGLPQGNYAVEVYVQNQKFGSATFQIE